MKGLKRQIAKEKQRGDGRIEVGKEPMKFELYKFLARKFLEMSGSDGIFGWCFLVLSWNLACRSSNTCTLQLKHFRWVEDCFSIYFAHQKNDQGAPRKKMQRLKKNCQVQHMNLSHTKRIAKSYFTYVPSYADVSC
jgi:hypothetical protein